MKTFAKTEASSSTKRVPYFSALSIVTARAAVFVFDQMSGQVMLMNAATVDLLSRFKLDKADRLSLAVIERGIMADARTTTDPAVSDGLLGEAAELCRVARQPDGSVLVLSRVWAPGVLPGERAAASIVRRLDVTMGFDCLFFARHCPQTAPQPFERLVLSAIEWQCLARIGWLLGEGAALMR